jgi:hypothetical protein
MRGLAPVRFTVSNGCAVAQKINARHQSSSMTMSARSSLACWVQLLISRAVIAGSFTPCGWVSLYRSPGR